MNYWVLSCSVTLLACGSSEENSPNPTANGGASSDAGTSTTGAPLGITSAGGMTGSTNGAASSANVSSSSTSGGEGGSGGSPVVDPLGRKRRIAVDDNRVCVISDQRQVVCWGSGTGSDPPPESDNTFDAIASKADASCARRTDGSVICWGFILDGSPTGTFSDFSVGNSYFCGLDGSDMVVCFATAMDDPTPSGAPSIPLSAIDSGLASVCGLDFSGAIHCWGEDLAGGETNPPAGTFTQIAFGTFHGCALSLSGTASCWGQNGQTDGQVIAPDGVFRQVAAGNTAACGIRADNSVQCWGMDDIVDAVPEGAFIEVSVGERNACGIQPDGQVLCWPPINGGRPEPDDLRALVE